VGGPNGTSIGIHGGVRVIGGTKVLISTPRARVLLDIGEDIPGDADLLRDATRVRAGHALADRLRLGAAPRIAGLFAPEQLRAVGPGADDVAALAAEDPRPLVVVLSHAHIDHDGLLPHLREDVRVLAHPDTISLHQALEEAGLTAPGTAARLAPIEEGEELALEDLTITVHRVDHDVRGAVGTIVRAPDGVLAYTGDINLHREGGEHTRAFLAAARGADVLVCETTMLSFDPLPPEPRSEEEVARTVIDALAGSEDLMLLSAYERDVDRAALLIRAADGAGRTLVWPGRHAAVLTAMGIDGVVTWDGTRPQSEGQRRAGELAVGRTQHAASTVGIDAVQASPGRHLVQIDPEDFTSLLDLPLGPASAWIHSQGEPLGPFMRDWDVWQDWLERLGLATVPAGSSGHAGPGALREIVERIAPDRVIALHGFHPERLEAEGVQTVLPEIGAAIPLAVPDAP
jgi:ribonuclease J